MNSTTIIIIVAVIIVIVFVIFSVFRKRNRYSKIFTIVIDALSKIPRESPSIRDEVFGSEQGQSPGSNLSSVEWRRRRNQTLETIRNRIKARGVFNVPFFTSNGDMGVIMLQLEKQSPEDEKLMANAIRSGKVDFQVTYHELAEYPVLRCLLTIHDQPGNPFWAEGFPRLTDGNTIDFMRDVIMRASSPEIILEVFSGSECERVEFSLHKLNLNEVATLTSSVNSAINQWIKERPPTSNHRIAINKILQNN